MSIKFKIGCCLGTGGIIIVSYHMMQHIYGPSIIITPNPTNPGKFGSNECLNPTYKATIRSDLTVEYYICSDTTEAHTPSVETSIKFKTLNKQSTFTWSSGDGQANKWVYKKIGKETAMDIYWFNKPAPTSRNIFFIKQQKTSTPTINLKDHNDIRNLVGEIEQMRVWRNIEIKSNDITDKQIDSITCRTNKQATIQNLPNVEYYICSIIVDQSKSTPKTTPMHTTSSPFQQDASFNTKQGEKHTITKWQSWANIHPSISFYWFKPTTVSVDNKKIFFLMAQNITDQQAQQFVFEIETFRKQLNPTL